MKIEWYEQQPDPDFIYWDTMKWMTTAGTRGYPHSSGFRHTPISFPVGQAGSWEQQTAIYRTAFWFWAC